MSARKPPFKLGAVGHFGLAVRSPKKSAKWFERALGLKKQFEFDGGVAIGNGNVTIALHKGKPSPKTIGHMSFHLPNMSTLRKALVHLKKHKVDIEDPGDVLTFQPHRGTRLAREALHHLRIRGPVGQDEFERDALLQLDVHRRDHDPHAARGKHLLDEVLPVQELPRLDG